MKTYLSIDVGGTAIKYGLLHEDGAILSTDSIPTPKESIEEFYAVLDEIVSPVSQTISGIAMSMPGRIDNQTGHVHTGGAISRYMTNVPLGTLLSERYHLPVAIENDGKCAALAELWLGNLKDVESGAVMLVGYGIGGGIVLNRRLYRGIHDTAGEFCCMLTDYSKNITSSLFNTSNGIFGLLRPYAERKQIPADSITGKDFFLSLENQDKDAQQVFDHYIHHFVSGIFTLQAVLDLERICIGGGISKQELLILALSDAVSKEFEHMPNYIAVHQPQIVACAFNNDANLIGALKNFIDIHR